MVPASLPVDRGPSIPHAQVDSRRVAQQLPAAGPVSARVRDSVRGQDLARGQGLVVQLRPPKLDARNALHHVAVAEGPSNIRRPKKVR